MKGLHICHHICLQFLSRSVEHLLKHSALQGEDNLVSLDFSQVLLLSAGEGHVRRDPKLWVQQAPEAGSVREGHCF